MAEVPNGRIPVVMVGYGKVMQVVAKYLQADEEINLLSLALVAEGMDPKWIGHAYENSIELFYPQRHEEVLQELKEEYGTLYAMDFTAPSAVIPNAERYIRLGIHFQMGTTGGDRDLLEKMIRESNIAALVAPNMASQIVMLEAMLAWAAEQFDKPFAGWQLLIEESHQPTKKDPSGTALKMAKRFQELGASFDETDPNQLVVIRDYHRAMKKGVPPDALDGHGFHDYTLYSPDRQMQIGLQHNIIGREPYGPNVVRGFHFLRRKVTAGETGFFTMIDALKKQQ